jgi:hypothetical protein
VRYGGLYGSQHVCAQRPMLTCDLGQTETFIPETQDWQCKPTCDNGQFDQVMYQNQLVCVPC